jgi:hypothetical protein
VTASRLVNIRSRRPRPAKATIQFTSAADRFRTPVRRVRCSKSQISQPSQPACCAWPPNPMRLLEVRSAATSKRVRCRASDRRGNGRRASSRCGYERPARTTLLVADGFCALSMQRSCCDRVVSPEKGPGSGFAARRASSPRAPHVTCRPVKQAPGAAGRARGELRAWQRIQRWVRYQTLLAATCVERALAWSTRSVRMSTVVSS